MFNVISSETITIGDSFDFDRYEIEIKTPISTKELTIIVDFKDEEISGDIVAYGDWHKLPIEDCLEYISKVKKPIRDFDTIVKKYNKPKTYKIEINETLTHIVEIIANSKEEALHKVTKKYNEEEIILTADDLFETIFREFK